jgi:hypothetical protein
MTEILQNTIIIISMKSYKNCPNLTKYSYENSYKILQKMPKKRVCDSFLSNELAIKSYKNG